MKFIWHVSLIVLALGLSSCASDNILWRSGDIMNTTVQITPVDKSFIQGKKIAKNGDLLFEQMLMAKNTAKLVEPFHYFDKTTQLKIDIKTNNYLFKLSKIENTYCTFEATRSKYEDAAEGDYNLQSCLIDTNSDGSFDKIYYAGKNAEFSSSMSNNILVVERIEMTPIGYIPLESNSKIGVESGVRLAGKHFFERARLEFVMKSNLGTWEVFSEEDIKFNKSVEYPRDINFLGAQLRIHNISKEQVEYEVLSGFRKGEIFTLR